MTKQDFTNKHGNVEQTVTGNYATKSLGTNYDIKDAFIEFCDNAYDARCNNGEKLNFEVKIDNGKKTFILTDNGKGIIDAENLFIIGGTNKENDKGKIGKYGIGVPGATAAIATSCVCDKSETVEVIFKSACNGTCFEKHIAYFPDGDCKLGITNSKECDIQKHYSEIIFTNVQLKNYAEVIDAMEETFEEPLHKDLNISFNGRQLGKSNKRTFVGDEKAKTIMVGDFQVDIKYRIIGGDTSSSNDRSFEESGLRIYDKNTGRLLGKGINYWKYYCGKSAQQNICGLRAAIYIDSSIECYNKFGIKPAKNGITWSHFYKKPEFKSLAEELKVIYGQACKTKPSDSDDNYFENGDYSFLVSKKDIKDLYREIDGDNKFFLVKNKYKAEEFCKMIIKVEELTEENKKLIEENKKLIKEFELKVTR